MLAHTEFQSSIRSLGIEFRGLTGWPRPLTPAQERRRSPFGPVTFERTIRLLKHELRQVAAENARVQLALPDDQVRLDGLPRAGAVPAHPGVILSFDKPDQGRLVYPCDTFRHWHANLRAIALTLQALRRPERYGVLVAGEQYSGSKLLTAGGTATTMTARAAAEYLARWTSTPNEMRDTAAALLRDPALLDAAYRAAAGYVHPDRGGNADIMDLLTKARDTLRAHHGLGRSDEAPQGH